MQVAVVTRHPALITYLVQEGVIPSDVEVISHATPEQVRGKHIIGVLPMNLAAEAAKITCVDLILRPDQRGKELSLEDIQGAQPKLTTYVVRKDE